MPLGRPKTRKPPQFPATRARFQRAPPDSQPNGHEAPTSRPRNGFFDGPVPRVARPEQVCQQSGRVCAPTASAAGTGPGGSLTFSCVGCSSDLYQGKHARNCTRRGEKSRGLPYLFSAGSRCHQAGLRRFAIGRRRRVECAYGFDARSCRPPNLKSHSEPRLKPPFASKIAGRPVSGLGGSFVLHNTSNSCLKTAIILMKRKRPNLGWQHCQTRNVHN